MPQTKLRLYFDTSVPSSFYDADTPEQTALTRLFWEDYLQKFSPYISEVTLQEIQRTEQLKKRENILKLLKSCSLLKFTRDIEYLADAYLKAYLVPRSYPIDGLHIACATFYKIDFLVTWNIRHMANPNQRKKLTDFNTSSKLFVPQLTTPEELIKTYGEEKNTTE